MSVAKMFEDGLSRWSTLKLISMLWKHKFSQTQEDWKNAILINTITSRAIFGQSLTYAASLRIDRLQRDRDRARKLLVQLWQEVDSDLAGEELTKKYEAYLKYAVGTDKDKV